MVPSGTVRAGDWGCWSFIYTAGERGVPVGGGIDILFPFSTYPIDSWSPPQDPFGKGYCTAHTTSSQVEVKVKVDFLYKGNSMIYRVIRAMVRKAPLRKGEKIIIT